MCATCLSDSGRSVTTVYVSDTTVYMHVTTFTGMLQLFTCMLIVTFYNNYWLQVTTVYMCGTNNIYYKCLHTCTPLYRYVVNMSLHLYNNSP